MNTDKIHDDAREKIKDMYEWTKEQKEELVKIADSCKEADSLAPLYAAIYISKPEPLTEGDKRSLVRLMKSDKEGE